MHTPYPTSDQDGLHSLYKELPPPPPGAKNALEIMSLTAYASETNNRPTYLREQFHRTSEIPDYDLRGSNYNLQIPLPKTNFLKRSFSYRGAMAWNYGTNCQIKHVR